MFSLLMRTHFALKVRSATCSLLHYRSNDVSSHLKYIEMREKKKKEEQGRETPIGFLLTYDGLLLCSHH